MTDWQDPEDLLLDSLAVARENKDFRCRLCKYLYKDRLTCDAFPKKSGGIHSEILTGLVRHDKPQPGLSQENKIVFGKK